MRRKSCIASVLAAMGRVSPWAKTRAMWSSGVACNQIVKHCPSSRVKVASSDTKPPGVANTAWVLCAKLSSKARLS